MVNKVSLFYLQHHVFHSKSPNLPGAVEFIAITQPILWLTNPGDDKLP